MNLILPCYSVLIIILIISIFYSKERAKNEETKIYSILLVLSLFNIIFNICGIYTGYTFGAPRFLYFLNHVDLPLYFSWSCLLFLYLLYVHLEKTNLGLYKKIKKIILSLNFMFIIISFFLPIEIIINEEAGYAIGPCVSFVYTICGLYLISCLIIAVMLLFDKSQSRKTIPIFVFMFLGILAAVIQKSIPSLIIIPAMIVFIELLMYFTIENPDLKMIYELNIAKEQAEKANHAKSDFLSSMSHEIRTPLNAIVGLSEDVLNREDIPEDMKEDLEDIAIASKTLLEIVGNIMDINKIESDKMELLETPYNFREEAKTLAKVNATRIGDKNIEFNVNIAEDIPYELIGDKIHVKQIINNLLSNAIKYTDEGEINFNAKCINQEDKTLLIISVKDTGRGIKAENITKLFSKFERLDVERNTTTEGTGLGLAITKKLVELMDGKINVESSFGKGSLFIVQIPQKISRLNEPLTKTTQLKEQYKEEPQVETNNKKILIVDDNELNIKVAKRVLKDFNFEIDECYNGVECLEKINSGNEYDLILMDIMMPIMGGEKTIQELKMLDDFKTPVLALTADAVSGAKEKYIQQGFVDYIAKPFSKEQIKIKIDEIFSKNQYNKCREEIDIL